jgi:hypothetical protein
MPNLLCPAGEGRCKLLTIKLVKLPDDGSLEHYVCRRDAERSNWGSGWGGIVLAEKRGGAEKGMKNRLLYVFTDRFQKNVALK